MLSRRDQEQRERYLKRFDAGELRLMPPKPPTDLSVPLDEHLQLWEAWKVENQKPCIPEWVMVGHRCQKITPNGKCNGAVYQRKGQRPKYCYYHQKKWG